MDRYCAKWNGSAEEGKYHMIPLIMNKHEAVNSQKQTVEQ